MTPYEQLAAAVIGTAWDEAQGHVVDETLSVAEGARIDAISFLTDAAGPWADSRRFWADAAGCDSDDLRRRALVALPGASGWAAAMRAVWA